MGGLKDKDLEVLQAVEAHYSMTGFVLSLAEAAEAVGMSKGSVISDIFKRLEVARVIVYSENRKQYLPTRWRELIAGATPDQNATPEFEALQEENEKLRKKFNGVARKNSELVAEMAKLREATESDGMKRIREQNRLRAKKYRDNKKTK